jgi:hypothetical protein
MKLKLNTGAFIRKWLIWNLLVHDIKNKTLLCLQLLFFLHLA